MSVAPSGDAELQRLVAEVERRSPPSYTLITELLSFLTAQHFHEPQLIVKHGRALIVHHRGKLGDKVWDMYERVLIAALDVRDDDAVNWCLEALLLKFGSSGLRMSRLLGLHCEYHQRWEEAVEHYEAILAADPTNITAYKRLIAVAKSRGKVDDAISRLVRYTKTFAADETGWVELCDLYVQQQQMELAGFAMEECILIAPENHQYHTRYAELLYASGRYELARQYFAQSVELKPINNLRALYGIIMSIRQKPSSGSAALYAWSVEKLLNHYRKYAPPMLPIVQQSLELALTPGPAPSPATTITTTSRISSSSSSPSASLVPSASSTFASSSSSSSSTSASLSTSTSASSVASVDKAAGLTTAGVRITESDGDVLQSGEENEKEAERVASVLAATGLRERAAVSKG